jgi:hypothetical protein
MALKVNTASLREAARQIRGWDSNVSGARSATDGMITTFGNGSTVTPDPHHASINQALKDANATWSESFRLTSRDLTLLGKILDVGAQHFDLKDDELANLVNNQG